MGRKQSVELSQQSWRHSSSPQRKLWVWRRKAMAEPAKLAP